MLRAPLASLLGRALCGLALNLPIPCGSRRPITAH